MKIRNLITWPGFLMLAALFVAACGTTTTAPAGATPAAPAALRGEITFLIGEDPNGFQAFKDLVTAFSKVQPGVKVTLNNVPDGGEFLKRLAADFAAKTAPDIFEINYRQFGQFAIKGALEPVDDYLARSKVVKTGDFYAAALEAFKFKGKQYCIPQNLSSLEVYYNKKLFAAANVPLPKNGWTWNDFLSAARALTKDTNGDGKPDQYGAGIAASTLRLAPFIWAHGGELVDDANKPTKLMIDSGPALEAFKWFVELQTKEHVVPSKADEATESSQSRFQHGTLAMFFQSRVVTPDLRQTIKDFDWDVAPLPGDKTTVSILHSDGYCLTSASKNKDAAWAFTEFANGSEGQKSIVTSGRTVPSLKSVAESPAFLNPAALPANGKVYLDMAPNIRRVPIMTTWLDIEDILNKEIKRAFYGDATVEEAAQAAIKGTADSFKQNLTDLGAP
ncbi:MAG: sugar ABC transporter substrate-binding protein [Chloroflexi bacterium]|nr:sugar ABC transporter substrate-binding protein [Chloroflexota bacterium]